jgi:hypothetical protein
MDKSFRSIPVVKDKSSKILLGSSSASSTVVAVEVGVAAESEAQSSADVDVALLRGSSHQSNMENLQLLVGVVYDCDGSQWWVTWRASIGCLDGN